MADKSGADAPPVITTFPKATPPKPMANPYIALKKEAQARAAAAAAAESKGEAKHANAPLAEERPRSPPTQAKPRKTSSSATTSKKERAKSPPRGRRGVPAEFDADDPDDKDFRSGESGSDSEDGSDSEPEAEFTDGSDSSGSGNASEAEEVDEVDSAAEAEEVRQATKARARHPKQAREKSPGGHDSGQERASLSKKRKRGAFSEEEKKTRPSGLARSCDSWDDLDAKLAYRRMWLAFLGAKCKDLNQSTPPDTRKAKELYEAFATKQVEYVDDVEKLFAWAVKTGDDPTAFLG